MRGYKKGQTAMEYLMTYGWAILIIIIVAAALFALGVFNPGTFTQSTATGFPQIQVPTGGWSMSGSADTLTLVFANQAGAVIDVTAVKVSIGTNVETNDTTTNLGPIGNNGAIQLSPNQQAAVNINMGTSGGNPAGGVDYTAGTSYTAQVEITYTNTNTGLQQKSSGTVTGVVV